MTAQLRSRAHRAALFLLLCVLAPVSHAGAFSDFDGDGRSDIFWRHGTSGENYIYPMDGRSIRGGEGYARTVTDANWRVVGIGNFDGAGGADVLWRNEFTGETYLYLMNGTAIAGEGYVRTVADPYWLVAGVGDFDGDGKDDILWRNLKFGHNYVFLMDGVAIKSEGYIRSVLDQRWQIAGVGDFDGDQRSDILWRNIATGENYLYPMDGLVIKPSEGFLRTVSSADWQIAGIGDFDADGRADILWRHRLTGENYVYPMNGTTILGHERYLRTVADVQWQVATVANYDGAGGADILWRHAGTGENYIYFMNGLAIADEGYVRTVSEVQWKPVGRTPLAEFEELPTDPETMNRVLDFVLGTYVFEVPATCSGNPTVACPGGTPSNPLPKVQVSAQQISITQTSPTAYNFSVTGTVVSLNNIPFRYNLSGIPLSCSAAIDTNAGNTPTVTVTGTALFGRHLPRGPINRVDLASVQVGSVENADVRINGGGNCALLDSLKGFFEDLLLSSLEDALRRDAMACGAPGAQPLVQCPGPAIAAQ